jgi:hypothetical protein
MGRPPGLIDLLTQALYPKALISEQQIELISIRVALVADIIEVFDYDDCYRVRMGPKPSLIINSGSVIA